MRASMSIWFFAGIMLLAYGIVILDQPVSGSSAIRSRILLRWRNCTPRSGGERCSRFPAPSTPSNSGQQVRHHLLSKFY